MANTGRRLKCICTKTMTAMIGKQEIALFTRGKQYACTVKDDQVSLISYKIYGDEFDLSCTEKEFNQYFEFIKK